MYRKCQRQTVFLTFLTPDKVPTDDGAADRQRPKGGIPPLFMCNHLQSPLRTIELAASSAKRRGASIERDQLPAPTQVATAVVTAQPPLVQAPDVAVPVMAPPPPPQVAETVTQSNTNSTNVTAANEEPKDEAFPALRNFPTLYRF